MILPDPPILVITDRKQCGEALETRASGLFKGGCRWLSLREKDMEPAERLDLLKRLTHLGRPFGATVGVHDDIAATLACKAALHLPAGSNVAEARRALGPGALIGKSCHDVPEIAAARAEGANYATLSPVFQSASKPGYNPTLDMAALSAAAQDAVLPVVALGGITLATLPRLKDHNFAGVAVMGEAMTATDPESWFRGMLTML